MIKKKGKCYRRLSASKIAIGIATGLLVFSIFSTVSSIQKNGDLSEDLNDALKNIKLSESYQEYIDELEADIYSAYKEDVISSNEFTEKINYINSNQFIYDEGQKFLDKDTYFDVVQLAENETKTMSNTGLGVMGTIFSAIGIGITGGMTYEANKSCKNEEMRKQLREQEM